MCGAVQEIGGFSDRVSAGTLQVYHRSLYQPLLTTLAQFGESAQLATTAACLVAVLQGWHW